MNAGAQIAGWCRPRTVERLRFAGADYAVLPLPQAGPTAWRLLGRGEGLVYHLGSLAADRLADPALDRLADLLAAEARAKQARLFMYRFEGGFAYVAIRR